MKSKLISAALLAGAAVVAQGAFAADGTITFTGSITAQTCQISGNGGGPNFTVALPQNVSTGTFKATGDVAGRTPFNIALTNCTPDSGSVHTFFEQGPTIDTVTGFLKLDAGGAQNVEIELLNSDFSTIALNQADSGQNSKSTSISKGAATLNYFAQYHSTGAVTAGPANSSVMYTMSYQ